MSKKVIIFGAGNFGRSAYKYYGEENVAFFADNNSRKKDQLLFGKRILDFEEYKNISENYFTVIAVNAFSEIADQLRKNGIDNFGFYSPRYTKYMARIENELKNGDVLLFGLDSYTELVYNEILKIRKKDQIAVSVKEQDTFVGTDYYGNVVLPFEKTHGKYSNIIISCSENNAALDVFCRRIADAEVNILNPFIQMEYYDTDEIIYSGYENSGRDQTESEWNEAVAFNRDKKELNGYVDQLALSSPLFEHVEIETVNRCNGVCDFCPVSIGNDIRERCVMDEKLYKKIVDQLAELGYSGRFATFSNNEPFIDSRIIEFNKYAREKLPKTRIHLFTNGTLLTLEKFIDIIPYLDELIIDNYNQELKLIPNAEAIKDYCEKYPELKKKVTIVLRKPHEILTSRGGDAPNRKDKKSYPDIKCALPYKQLIVRPDGKVSLCCNDPYGKCTLGDLSKDSVVDVWYGSEFKKVRKALSEGRGRLEHCKYCDTFIIF